MKTTSRKICTSFVSAAAILFAAPFAAQAVTTFDLFAGQHLDVGSVTVSNDSDNLYINYHLDDPRASFGTLHAWAGGDLIEIPTNPKGIPNSGHFLYKPDATGLTDYTITIPFSSVNVAGVPVGTCQPLNLVVVTHAEVGVDYNGNGVIDGDDEKETAYAGDNPVNVDDPGRWWYYGNYNTICWDSLETVTYSISGKVVIDADLNGPDEGEMGISNVTVELRDDAGNVVASMPTSESGGYEFTGLPVGDYSVVVLPENDILDDFNEILADYFFATTETEVTVTLTEDVVENFGFAPDVDKVIADIDGVTLKGDGLTIGFWKHQNAVADKGKGRAQVDAETLQGYIDTIEELLLEEPFQFDDANEFKAAHEVMAMQTSDAVELLKKQLLGTEFNDVAGRGLEAPFNELQDKLIAWGEYLAANSELFTRDELIDAKDIFDLINNSGHM